MIFVVILYLLFATTFTLGKAALAYVTPFLFIGVRMMLGGSLLLLYTYFFSGKKISIQKKDYISFIHIIMFHIFCSYTLEFWALEYVTSAKACLLYNLSPFISAVLSYLFFAERLTMRQLSGLIIGFLGFIPILIAQSPLEQIAGHIGFLSCYEGALIVSVTSSAYGWIVMKGLIHRGYSFILINGIGMVGGGILAFILSLIVEGWPVMKHGSQDFFALGAYSIALIIIANIICYNLYGYLLLRYSPTFLSFAGFMTPLFAALLGWFFLGEPVSWHFFATIIFVIIGLSLFHEKKPIIFEEKGL